MVVIFLTITYQNTRQPSQGKNVKFVSKVYNNIFLLRNEYFPTHPPPPPLLFFLENLFLFGSPSTGAPILVSETIDYLFSKIIIISPYFQVNMKLI